MTRCHAAAATRHKLSRQMIGNEPWKGTLKDRAKGETEGGASFTKLRLIMPGYAADEGYRQVLTVVGTDMMTQKILEIADDNSTDCGVREVMMDKYRERSQEAVGERLAVNMADNLRQR